MRTFHILLLLGGLLWACSSETQADEQNAATRRIAQVWSCNSCSLDKFIIPSVDSMPSGKIKIDKPVAVAFFHLLEIVSKYGGRLHDSLPEKMKHDNRQSIYRTIDQNGTYKAFIVPHLDSLGIEILSGNFRDKVLTFTYNNQPYTIGLTYFNENDGVVLYTPGKKPILWTLENGLKDCTDHDFVECYFK